MIADRIKELRINNGFTQSELAQLLHITRASVNAWEMGISIPSTNKIIELSEILHASADYLLGINKTTTLDVSGLNDSDIELLLEIVKHLKNHNNVK